MIINIGVAWMIQRWIKKKNYRQRHAKVCDTPHSDARPAAKRIKQNPWQIYMKEFGSSTGMLTEIYCDF